MGVGSWIGWLVLPRVLWGLSVVRAYGPDTR